MSNSSSNKVQNIRNIGGGVTLAFTGGVTPKGAYDAGTAYATGDSVSYNGSSYVAKTATTGHLPTDTTYWQILASKGETGLIGETGAQGDKGDTGDTGAKGDTGDTGAKGDTGASINDADFVGDDIVFTKDDASTVTLTGAKITLKGEKGDQGNPGADGATGPTGTTGPQGPQGDPGIVQSVNGQSVADVVLDYEDVGAAPALGTDDNYVTDAEKTKLSNLSGTNTGDQDLSGLVVKSGSLTQLTTRSHADLQNLTADDHSQYALLAGRSGGQTIIGGTGVTDKIVLQGTSGNGTAASPALQVNVGNNGATTALTVLNNGDVGIGTTSPTSKLTIQKDSASTDFTTDSNNIFSLDNTDTTAGNLASFAFRGGGSGYQNYNAGILAKFLRTANGGADLSMYVRNSANGQLIQPLYIKANGNVGIGTTSPGITEKGVALAIKLHTLLPDSAGAGTVIEIDTTTAARGPFWAFARKRSAGLVSSGDSLGRFMFEGHDGVDYIPAAQIQAEVDGTASADDMPGRLTFSTTADGAQTLSERMRIDSSGNVGIGTTSPTSKLHLNGTLGALSGGLAFGDGDTGLYESSDDVLRLQTLGTDRVTVLANGNVGIGTTSPEAKLHVGNGNILVDNSFGLQAINNVGIVQNLFSYNQYNEMVLGGSNVVIPITSGTRYDFKPAGLGIGFTTPASKLSINGGVSIGGSYNVAAPSNGVIIEGNVGIGTTSPAKKLDVAGTLQVNRSASDYLIKLMNGSTTVGLFDQNGANMTIISGGTLTLSAGGSNQNVILSPTGTGYVQLNGNVGIGTTSPTARTHVRGAGTTSSTLGLLVETSGGTANLTIRDDGAFAFRGGTVGLADSGWSVANKTESRTLDCDSVTLDGLADIVGTILDALKLKGIISS